MSWNSLPEYLAQNSEGVIIFIYVQPGSKTCQWLGLTGDGYLKLKVKAKAQESKANQELIKFLALLFQLPKKNLEIISGEKSRRKRILVRASLNLIQERLKILEQLKSKSGNKSAFGY